MEYSLQNLAERIQDDITFYDSHIFDIWEKYKFDGGFAVVDGMAKGYENNSGESVLEDIEIYSVVLHRENNTVEYVFCDENLDKLEKLITW